MPNRPENAEDLSWLLSPPVAGEVRILVAIGDGADLPARLSEAIDRLAAVLQEVEIEGYSNGRYFIPFPSATEEVGGFSGQAYNPNFGFRAVS